MATNLLTKGGNVVLPTGITTLRVGLAWEAPNKSYDLDAWSFMLAANGRVPSDEYFIFFNNMVSPCGTVFVSEDSQQGGNDEEDDEVVTVELSRVPSNIDRIVFVVNIHEGAQNGQNFGQLDNASIRLTVPSGSGFEEIARYNMGDNDVSTETSLVFGELYRYKGSWKFRAIAQGQASGPAKLAREFGVDVDGGEEDQVTEPLPVPTPPVEVVKPVVPKLNLTKGKIDLTKDGAAARIAVTPSMEFSLYWTKRNKDLGLILLVTHKDGRKCSYDWRRLRDDKGEVLHHGDRMKGGGDVREYTTIKLRSDTTIAAIAIAAYSEVSNGIGSFRSMGAYAVIDDGSGTQVKVDLNKGGTFSYHTVIASILVNGDGTVTVRRESRFSKSGKEQRPEIDQHGNISMNTGPVVMK